ncbi:hypothetical protein [Alcaligenes endophyticus]|uniref:Uncharacterized protein n=1 Tax=Alcaligenes endophyticus TaxID=1929088 RepID=A0ABT8EN97_9BURK|nr:hypothetical protein [Alcaligenes endophyticus]MCX5591380.1 hypothetical protein [Alcaligenes endophyticus]MDN4122739.1 hypothetical protein [Alcaligenes endophyticus]
MLSTFVHYALPFSATLLVACAFACLVSGLYLFLFNLRKTNQALKHPYLEKYSWEQLPLSLKMGILLDYFIRLNFSNSRGWIFGQANTLLPHVKADTVPLSVKWPLMGFWGGCLLGIISMLSVWALIGLQTALA